MTCVPTQHVCVLLLRQIMTPFLANVCGQLSVMQCSCRSRMLTAAAGLHRARTGHGWIRGAARAAALAGGSALGMRMQPRALLVEDGVLVLVVVCC
jgi:hypothetical protein